MRTFVVKTCFWTCLLLIEFQVFTACRSCTKVIVVHEMHWKRVGSAGNAKEWATAHFWVSVVTENFDSLSDRIYLMSRQRILDMGSPVS